MAPERSVSDGVGDHLGQTMFQRLPEASIRPAIESAGTSGRSDPSKLEAP